MNIPSASAYIESAVSQRDMGQLSISIGTSLALEGAFGIHPDRPSSGSAPIKQYDALYVNIRTLIRNFIGAIDPLERPNLYPEIIVRGILNELSVIEAYVHEQTGGRVEVTPYLCRYTSIQRKFPLALHRQLKTDNLKFWHAFEESILDEIKKTASWIAIEEYDIDFADNQKTALILTHYSIDLLQKYRFRSLSLLESHTGKIKPPAFWYTKLTRGSELYPIPFDRMTIQMFGDGSNLFNVMSLKSRRLILAQAEKDRWTPMSTKLLILNSIKKIGDPILYSYVQDLYGKS